MKEENRLLSLEATHIEEFGSKPEVVFSSPGRIEIVGNHTDHQGGKVLAAAVSLNILAVVSKRSDNKVFVHSKNYPLISIDLNDTEMKENEKGTSLAMVRGVADFFKKNGKPIIGFSASTQSNVPKGAGVSSSSAFEVLIATIFNDLTTEKKIDPLFAAKAAQYAENIYFGKPSGMMDQTIIALGSVNTIDFFDLSDIRYKHADWKFDDIDIFVINTEGNHSDLTDDYAAILTDMKKVSKYFNKERLSQISDQDFRTSYDTLKESLGEKIANRALHYFDEIKRVEKAFKAISEKNKQTFLNCVNESGESSKKLLQNLVSQKTKSTVLIDALDKASKIDGVIAKRVHGGGFAGTILIFADSKKNIEKQLNDNFGEDNVFKIAIEPFPAHVVKNV